MESGEQPVRLNIEEAKTEVHPVIKKATQVAARVLLPSFVFKTNTEQRLTQLSEQTGDDTALSKFKSERVHSLVTEVAGYVLMGLPLVVNTGSITPWALGSGAIGAVLGKFMIASDEHKANSTIDKAQSQKD
jgi:hypothetical protein